MWEKVEMRRVLVKRLRRGWRKYLVLHRYRWAIQTDYPSSVPLTQVQQRTPLPQRDCVLSYVWVNRFGVERRWKEVPCQAVWSSAPNTNRWDSRCWCPFQKQKVNLIRLMVRVRERLTFRPGHPDPMVPLWGDHGPTWERIEYNLMNAVPRYR